MTMSAITTYDINAIRQTLRERANVKVRISVAVISRSYAWWLDR